MQTIQLIAGDHDWTEEGSHIWNDNGFAIVLDNNKTIEVSDEVWLTIMPFIETSRINRGLNADGSVPIPPEPEQPLIEDIPDEP